jgi:uncharacterized protein (TIGR03790 family)
MLRVAPIMLTLALLVNLACSPVKATPDPPALQTEESRVMVVINSASTDSTEIGAYYRMKRDIPKENVVMIDCATTDNIPYQDFVKNIQDPVKKAIKDNRNRIEYVVLTKGVPIRLDNDGGWAVDAFLATMNMSVNPIDKADEEHIKHALNPYFEKDEPFSREKFGGLFLVTRLDGLSVDDAKRLVDNSLAAKPDKGPFFFDQAGNRNSEGYGVLNKALQVAADGLRTRSCQSALDTTDAFVAPSETLMGYCSWGSNDSKFNVDTYHKLKFKPGAIAETFVSTSARTFSRVSGGQSLVSDLIAQGVTGVKGYVSEPFTFALARPEILFDRYTKGYNLAESFYMASLVIKWKDVVIGDPLCRPYKH